MYQYRTTAKVTKIEAGARYQGITWDWWVTLQINDLELLVFDHEPFIDRDNDGNIGEIQIKVGETYNFVLKCLYLFEASFCETIPEGDSFKDITAYKGNIIAKTDDEKDYALDLYGGDGKALLYVSATELDKKLEKSSKIGDCVHLRIGRIDMKALILN